jgi:hypothetical protein
MNQSDIRKTVNNLIKNLHSQIKNHNKVQKVF